MAETYAIAGRVSIVPKGEWDMEKTYQRLDLVTYNRKAYLSKRTSVGYTPTDGDAWMYLFESPGVATETEVGMVIPDNLTILIDDNGEIHVQEMVGATESEDGKAGVVPKPTISDRNKALFGDGTYKEVIVDVDNEMSDESENPVQNKVVKKYVDDNKIEEMKGATPTEDGSSGSVPAPKAGDDKRALFGDGTWKDVETDIDIDAELSDASENPVQNKVVKAAIDSKQSKTGDSKDNTVSFSLATARDNIATGEKHSTLFGKIAKYFTDMKAFCFNSLVTSLATKPTAGSAVDAATVYDALQGISTDTSIISDAYSSTKTYAVGEYCIYNNSLYKCKTACTGQVPTNATYWTKVSVSNELGTLNTRVNSKGFTVFKTISLSNGQTTTVTLAHAVTYLLITSHPLRSSASGMYIIGYYNSVHQVCTSILASPWVTLSTISDNGTFTITCTGDFITGKIYTL